MFEHTESFYSPSRDVLRSQTQRDTQSLTSMDYMRALHLNEQLNILHALQNHHSDAKISLHQPRLKLLEHISWVHILMQIQTI